MDKSRSNRGLATLVRLAEWVSILVIVAGVVAITHLLPVGQGVYLLKSQLYGWGIRGEAAFAGIYVLATVLFIPGSPLGLAAGAIYGPLMGTALVSIGSTAGACLAYLIARYAMRRKMEERARQFPRFAAVNRAIGESGWKIVALVRLAPVFPFNLVNYLFGLTPIGFVSYALTSWLCMLPGTFVFVYAGYLGAQTIKGSAGGPVGGWPQMALKIVGLGAAILVIAYVTVLARRALARQTETAVDTARANNGNQPIWPRRATVLALSAMGVVILTASIRWKQSELAGLLGPPPVKLVNKFKHNPNGPKFNNSQFSRVVSRIVQPGGWVDYNALAAHPQNLNAYIAALARAPFAKLGRDQKLALLLNAYNAFTLRLILDYYPHIKSITGIPAAQRWTDVRWNIGGQLYSLDSIELMLRSDFADPRVHFAMVCASIGCPPLRNHAYEADRVEAQLQSQAEYLNHNPRWVRFSRNGRTLHLTRLYEWYGGDFRQAAGSVLRFAARYNKRLAADLAAGHPPTVVFDSYNWNLNSTAAEN